jgi:hypothetical protein
MFLTTPFFPSGPPSFGIGEFVFVTMMSMLLVDDSPILSTFPVLIEGESVIVADQTMDKRPSDLRLLL